MTAGVKKETSFTVVNSTQIYDSLKRSGQNASKARRTEVET